MEWWLTVKKKKKQSIDINLEMVQMLVLFKNYLV